MAIGIDKLPRNIEAEKATLGAMMCSRSAKDEALSSIGSAELFFDKNHQKIFTAIYNLNYKNNKVDIQTVTQELKNMKCLDEVGGVDYLYELTQSMLSEDNVTEYIDIVKENANLRNLLLAFGEIEAEYLKSNIDSFSSFVANAQKKIDKIAEERKISNFSSSSDIVQQVTHHIFDIIGKHSQDRLTGVNTGFDALNYYTNGLQNETLNIIAGRPGCGKTALALNIALNAAKSGVPVGIFEMEMSAISLYTRLVSNISSVVGKHISTGNIDKSEKSAIHEALETLSTLKIFVDESSALTILDLQAKARKLKTEEPNLGLLIIDHLGLISPDRQSNKKYNSRQLEIQEYTRVLHELARDLKIPVVLLCQLNRKVEDRGEGGIPRLSDLRESGSIEQDADIVLLLHREDYGKSDIVKEKEQEEQKKNANTGTTAANMSDESRRKLEKQIKEKAFRDTLPEDKKNAPFMDVIIAKNRNGEADRSFQLLFDKECSKFQDVPRDYYNKAQALINKYNEED